MSALIAVSGRGVRAAILGAACLVLIFSTSSRVTGNAGFPLLSTATVAAAGDVIHTGVAVGTNGVFVSSAWGQASPEEYEGFATRYQSPLANGAAPTWIRNWPGAPRFDAFMGVDTGSDGVYFAGASYSQTFDGVGGKERKEIVAKFDLNGAPGPDTGALWVGRQRFGLSTNGYDGDEFFNAARVSVEGGATYLYGAGHAQEHGCNNNYAIRKYTSTGGLVWQWQQTGMPCGGSDFNAIAVDGGTVYVAGFSSYVGNAPQIFRFPTGAPVPMAPFTGVVDAGFTGGSYTSILIRNGLIYAAGFLSNGERQSYLLDIWTPAGALLHHRVWSSDPTKSNGQQLTALVAIGSRVFAAGWTRNLDNPAVLHNMGGNTTALFVNNTGYRGFADGVIFEIDPATGGVLSSTTYGMNDAKDQAFTSATTDGIDLYVAGADRTSGTYRGIVLRYGISLATTLTTSATATYGGAATLEAMLSSVAGPVAGATIDFKLFGTSVGSAVTDSNGKATLTGVSIGGRNAGGYAGALDASFLASGGYQGTNAIGTLSIAPAPATITVTGAGTFVYDGQPHPASASVTGIGGESLGAASISYINLINGIISAQPPVNAGNYRIVATFGGNANYLNGENASLTTVILRAPTTTSVRVMGAWDTRPPMPFARNGSAAGVINNVIYVAGGWNFSHTTQLEAFDPATNSWTTKANRPSVQTHPAEGVINGKLYTAGGTNSSIEINEVRAYDPVTNSWSGQLAPMPTTRQQAASGVINSRLYVAGGINTWGAGPGGTFATLEEFDPAANGGFGVWATKPPMPTARRGAGGAVSGGIFYVIGGQNAAGIALNTVEAFDPAANGGAGAWTTKAPMPTPRDSLAAVEAGGLIFAIGGATGATRINAVEAYDPATNTWITFPSLTARNYLSAAAVGGTVYAIGGTTDVQPQATALTESLTVTPPTSSIVGQNINLVSTVRATTGAGTPSGNVLFRSDALALGDPPVNNGVASFLTSALGLGSHNLVADYSGDANFAPSSSGSWPHTVTILNHQPVITSHGGPYVINIGQDLVLNAAATDQDIADGDVLTFGWDLNNDGVIDHTDTNGTTTVPWATLKLRFGIDENTQTVTQSNLQLRVTDSFGSSAMSMTSLVIYPDVVIASLNVFGAVCSQTTSFDASMSRNPDPRRSIVSYEFDFGDGGTYAESAASAPDGAFDGRTTHMYMRTGSFTATVRVTDSSGKQGVTSTPVNVAIQNHQPFANAGGSYFADLGSDLALNGTMSSDQDMSCGDSIVSYAWTIDGGVVTASGATATVPAPQIDALGQGSHSVSLTVTDSFGASSTVSTSLTIYNNVPTASFTASPNPAGCNAPVSFNASRQHGRPDRGIVNFRWEFGDGSVVSGMSSSLNHAYTRFGQYTVTLTVTDNNTPPKTASTTRTLNINNLNNQAPQTNAGGPYDVAYGSPLTLQGTATDPNTSCGDSITSYSWTIDGTLVLTGQNPTLSAEQITALGVGGHTVVFRATDAFNATGSSQTFLQIDPVLVRLDTETDDGGTAASIAIGETQQFVGIARFNDGSIRTTAGGNDGGGDSGGGSGDPGSGGGGGGSSNNVGFWNVHFTPSLSFAACGGPGFVTSQSLGVNSDGQITNTQWSFGSPTVNVTGQVTPNQQAVITLSCIHDPALSFTSTLPWQTTSFEGPITLGGSTATAHITGWSAQPPMPAATFAAGAAAIGNKLYVVGGGMNGAPSGVVQVFDLAARTWEANAAPMSPREGPGVAVLNGFIYVAGGHGPGGGATTSLQRYDPVNNQWTMEAPMATPRAELQLVAAGGMLYALGGESGNGTQSPLNTVERYNPATNSWSTVAPMATARMFFSAGALNDGDTIIAVGKDMNGSGPSVELYDVALNSWSPTTPLSIQMSSGGSIANRFYVASRCGTFVYRPPSTTQNAGWGMMPNMLSLRSQFATAVHGDVMYAAGGFVSSPSDSLATFDSLSTPQPNDLFYSPNGHTPMCPSDGGGDGGGGDDDGGGNGPTWRLVDPITGMDSTIGTIDQTGLATGVAPGNALVMIEFGGMSCRTSSTCATLTVNKYTPAFTNLSAPAITFGTASASLSGVISAQTLVPTGSVHVTLNGVTTQAPIQPDGAFAVSFATAALGVAGSPYAVEYRYDGDANFNGATATTALTVNPAPSQIAITCAPNQVYAGVPLTPCSAVVTGAGGLNAPVPVSYTNNVGAGTAHASAHFDGDANHTSSDAGVDFEIARTALVVTANDATMVLHAPLPAFTVSYAGLVGSDTAASLGGTLSFTTPATSSSPVGTYPVTPGGLTSPNYAISFAAGTLTIEYDVCPLYEITRVSQQGSVVQISLRLCDASGNNESSAARTIQATGVRLVSTNVAGTPETPGNSNPDNNFRLTTIGGQTSYSYNLSTRGLAQGEYELLFMVSGDPSTYTVPFRLR